MITNVRRYVGRIKSKRQHSPSLTDPRPTTFDYYVMSSFLAGVTEYTIGFEA